MRFQKAYTCIILCTPPFEMREFDIRVYLFSVSMFIDSKLNHNIMSDVFYFFKGIQ